MTLYLKEAVWCGCGRTRQLCEAHQPADALTEIPVGRLLVKAVP